MSEELKPVAQIMGLADDYADARADETLITERGGVHLDPDSNDARAKLMLAVSALQSRIAELPPLTDAMRAVLRNERGAYQTEDELYAALCIAAKEHPHG